MLKSILGVTLSAFAVWVLSAYYKRYIPGNNFFEGVAVIFFQTVLPGILVGIVVFRQKNELPSVVGAGIALGFIAFVFLWISPLVAESALRSYPWLVLLAIAMLSMIFGLATSWAVAKIIRLFN
jgi:hypothetical protein